MKKIILFLIFVWSSIAIAGNVHDLNVGTDGINAVVRGNDSVVVPKVVEHVYTAVWEQSNDTQPTSLTIRLVKVGKMVTMIAEAVHINISGTGTIRLDTGSELPSEFRPVYKVISVVAGLSAGSAALIRVDITTDGGIEMGASPNKAAFGAGESGPYDASWIAAWITN